MARVLRTKGQIEAEISRAITQFEKEHMGRGPLEIRTYLIDDMIIVRLRGILTRAEQLLARAERTTRGRELIKQVRIELIETGRPLLEAAIKGITRRKLQSLFVDISTVSAEKIIVFTLDKPPELAPPV